ncbi:MAG: hypothetical protein GY854_28170 [Deltaproteobacteria bacterium]|nr:hypothetical protein [Deltaproteobacteria bacterium]
MQIPRWIVGVVALTAIAAVGECALIFSLQLELDDAKTKIERLSDQVAEVVYEGETPSKKKGENTQESERLKSMELQVLALKRRIDMFESGEIGEIDLDEVVDRKLGEKMMAAAAAIRGRMVAKASLSQISKQLDLTGSQKQQFTDAVHKSKESIMEMAELANSEDIEFVKDLNSTLKERMLPRKKIEAIKIKLARSNPPGSDDSYLQFLIDVRKRALEDLEHTLTEEQFEKFKTMRVSPFAVRIDR